MTNLIAAIVLTFLSTNSYYVHPKEWITAPVVENTPRVWGDMMPIYPVYPHNEQCLVDDPQHRTNVISVRRITTTTIPELGLTVTNKAEFVSDTYIPELLVVTSEWQKQASVTFTNEPKPSWEWATNCSSLTLTNTSLFGTLLATNFDFTNVWLRERRNE